MICSYIPWQHLYKISALVGEQKHFNCPLINLIQLKLLIFDLSHSQLWFYSLTVKTWSVGTCLEIFFAKFQHSIRFGCWPKAFLTPFNFSTVIFWQHEDKLSVARYFWLNRINGFLKYNFPDSNSQNNHKCLWIFVHSPVNAICLYV